MRIALLQFEPIFGEKKENLRRIEGLCSPVRADLFVLPELCTTGYQFKDGGELSLLAEPAGGETFSFFSRLAGEKSCCFVFGFAERAASGIFNSAALVSEQGCVGLYRKTHLFSREKDLFRPGDSGLRVFAAGRARVGLMICFDWIFPEAARTLALAGAQIIAHPANLVLPYCQQAMITRALENRVFTATCNRIGREERWPGEPLQFTGGSRIVGPDGKVLADAGAASTEVLLAEIDPARADDKYITVRNDLFSDRRPDFYSISR